MTATGAVGVHVGIKSASTALGSGGRRHSRTIATRPAENSTGRPAVDSGMIRCIAPAVVGHLYQKSRFREDVTTPLAGRRVRHLLLLIVLLAALLGQSGAIQAHLHFESKSSEFASAGREVDASSRSSDKTVPGCLLCKEAASAGAYLLPPVLQIVPVVPLVFRASTVVMVALALTPPAQGWLSRAPPR